MEIDEVALRLRTFIRQRFNVPEDDVEFNDDVDLYNYGYVDSFGAVDLNSFIEREFRLRFSEADLLEVPLNTIQQISIFIVRQAKK